jgi:hypothetical protein
MTEPASNSPKDRDIPPRECRDPYYFREGVGGECAVLRGIGARFKAFVSSRAGNGEAEPEGRAFPLGNGSSPEVHGSGRAGNPPFPRGIDARGGLSSRNGREFLNSSRGRDTSGGERGIPSASRRSQAGDGPFPLGNYPILGAKPA